MPLRSRSGPLKVVVFSLLPAIVLLVTGEVGARVYFTLRNRDAHYLVAPYGMARSYPFRIGATWTRHDRCTGRTLTLQSHDLGGQGPDWPRSKPPGRRLEHIVGQLPAWTARAQPDAVIYYEGYNNAYPYDVGRFHEGPGRLLYALYYSSMLYTYLVEKVNLAGATWEQTFAKEMALFRAQLPRFVARVRESGATPVFVLQVTDPLPDGPLDGLPVDDHAAVVAHIRRATTGRRSLTNAQAGVLIELVRRAGQELSVPVIDPRPVFAAHPEHRALFCSEVHLTDTGNQVLAEAIAAQLAPQLIPEGAAARTK